MDDQNASCIHDGEEYAQLSLLHLPMEIFLHICSFLDAQSLIHGLSLVCKQFYQILKDDDLFWKARIKHIWPNATHSLLCPVRPDKLFWKLSCIAIEKQTALWKQQDSMEKLINIVDHHHIETVLLIHNGTTCIASAIANYSLVYWKLPSGEKSFGEMGNTGYVKSAHENPIVDLTTIDNTIYSCALNWNIKSWMLTNTGLVHQRTYDMSVLESLNLGCVRTCISSCPERALFATGSSDGTIYVFDSRYSNKWIYQYRPHTKYMTKLAMNTEYILSASEDKTVSVWDQRAGRTMKSIPIPGGANPTCMSMRRDNWVCVGDTKAKLHMLNPKNNFELVKSYSTEHTDLITGVRLTHGCLITISWDGTVRISSPTDPPKPITTLRSEMNRNLYSSMDYMNDTLAVSSGGGIEVWRPKI